MTSEDHSNDIEPARQGISTMVRTEGVAPTQGSQTITDTHHEEQANEAESSVGILRLTGDLDTRTLRKIKWDEKVVDNEGMGRKKSKVCCIFHKARAVGESSDESSDDSDSDSDSDSGSDSGGGPTDDHDRGDCCDHNHRSQGKGKRKDPRDVSPNAYERQPRYKSRPQPPTNPHPRPDPAAPSN
ncbi:phosphatase inhibitor-domain-containing protein [Jimgerdemannia flammicorona]|uniref:Type 1 phosphatases regulator n=1 Tax=Jimgerdemannia flammicorona TaxID=994334 RepID=A0A433CY22_9FUNG|nr:phosphatase inhibitor-domain-containing protein [Jimgerdemannia flammicorona]